VTGTSSRLEPSSNGHAFIADPDVSGDSRRLGFGRLRAGWRRWRADEASGFGLQLFASFAAVIVLVGGVGYLFMSRELNRSQLRADAAADRADAQGFVVLGERATSSRDAIHDIGVILQAIGRRPGTVTALLVDQGHVVRAASDHRLVGTFDRDPRISAALSGGAGYVGKDRPGADVHGNFQFVVPVSFRGARYAYELEFNHRAFDQQVAGVRTALIVVGLVALLLGGGVFYLVGGRRLMRSHRYALQRATRDGLTELPNQRAFQDDLPRAVAAALRHQDALALAVVDVDDFKHKNDRHGHPHGDQVLQQVATVLRDSRAGDRAYRVGGDEFAALLPRADADDVKVLGRRLNRAFTQAGLKVSIGISLLRPGEPADILRAEADAALYEAKRRGGNRAVTFAEIQDHVSVTSSDRKDAVRDMIEQGGLTTVFQPIWDLGSGSLLGLEALSRPNPIYGFSGPGEAFDIAEQMGRVHDLDVLCVTDALSHISELPEETLLFLNLCPQTLDLDAERDQWLTHATERAGQPPERTVIEVTERFGGRAQSITKCLQLLRKNGFKIALDDVGTGNSGLEMLRNVQADYVKIDGSIVAAATTDRNARAVLLAMATYAHQTGAYVIAEGIEDEDTLAFLEHIHTTQNTRSRIIQGGQGFKLGKPAQTIQTAPPTILNRHPAAA
jgi:diguanylate cyclase (GGDEF)-like protein